MHDYSYIVHVCPAAPAGDGNPELADLQALCWKCSATVRWKRTTPGEMAASLAGRVLLIIVDFDRDREAAEQACRQARNLCGSPILLVMDPTHHSGAAPQPAAPPAANVAVVTRKQLESPEAVLQGLGIVLPAPELELDYAPNDLVINDILQWLGLDRLRNDIAKFFPTARQVALQPVAGGWSGARLCRLEIDGREYFLKFFPKSTKYISEHRQHQAASQWLALSGAEVPLFLVPGIPPDADAQLAAFPQPPFDPNASPDRRAAFPVCYVSAWQTGAPRQTLKALYRTKPDAYLTKAFKRLIEILANQPNEQPPAPESPWGLGKGKHPFQLTADMKTKIAATLDDLGDYGPAMCKDWVRRRHDLEMLLYGPPRKGLCTPVPVLRGHSHGDPNPRNCLVDPMDPADLRLIDCGDYSPRWRLVSDLALIERDIKLVLMGTEDSPPPGFRDLDTDRLLEWCDHEHLAAGWGIHFAPAHLARSAAPAGPCPVSASTVRAYRLVGLVRQRARTVCGTWDPDGVHYFAALLYHTVDALRYEAIRRTKRLLALYSAAELLPLF